jgi:YD repeat-containing protein
MNDQQNRTAIYKITSDGNEIALGYIGPDLGIYRLTWDEGRLVGRVDTAGRVFRKTTYDERELGVFTPDRRVRSHGLFEGGDLGWVYPDGVVVQAGLILGEEEVGRVDGPQEIAAGAALLLLFLPDDAEANH